MNPDEVRGLPVTVSVVEAGRSFRLGRDSSYALARRGEFPVPVLRLGRRLVVTRASLMARLGVAEAPVAPRSSGLASPPPSGWLEIRQRASPARQPEGPH